MGFESQALTKYRDYALTYPYFIMTLCLSGSARAMYDMKEMNVEKNDLVIILPGHMLNPIDATEDYRMAWLVFNPSLFMDSELKFNEKDLDFFSHAPICRISDEQVESMLSTLHVIKYICDREEEELPNKHRILEAQLSLAYELYLSIRFQNDREWARDHVGHLYLRFCDLVVAHYKQERNVNFYARLLGYDQRYFTKIFRAYNNGTSPHEWIQDYIATQAKRIMSENPKKTVKQVTFELGFPNTANFCRYFKNATGLTPNEFKQSNPPL